MATIHAVPSARHPKDHAPSKTELRQHIMAQMEELVDFTTAAGDGVMRFDEFERRLRDLILVLARTLIGLFLAHAEASVRARTPTREVRAGRAFQRRQAKSRSLTTWFGTVRYWRTYMCHIGVKRGRGYFPLDGALGLVSDRFTVGVLAIVVRLATKLSFAEAKATAESFLPVVPSTEVIEQATLGFGRFTSEWFEIAPAPEGDGDVLVILVDSKGAPTATERELRRRRGKRKNRPKAPSPRHRGRQRRGRYEPLPRRKKGEKSKNAKMATVLVMYTLRCEGTKLLGPINKRLYASFAPKKHAFEVARREADKRGFTRGSGKVIQIVTDGDNDLELYAGQLFPEATYHTLDVAHVVEKLWEAAGCLFREGSKDLRLLVEELKTLLFAGDIEGLLAELRRRRRTLGRGTKKARRRERLDDIIKYLSKRKAMMCYAELVDGDFEVGSGAVEGAVKNVVGKRCDQGGMRWICQRAEAVIQLRCIELNGDWDAFVEHVSERLQQYGVEEGRRVRIQRNEPAALPEVKDAA